MKLRKLLSTLLLLPAIFLSTDAMAAGHGGGELYDLANNIGDTLRPVMAGRAQADQSLKNDIINHLHAFLSRYHAEVNVLAKSQGLRQLVVEVADCAGHLSNFAPQSLQDTVGDLISFLQTNFVNRSIKIDADGISNLQHAVARTCDRLKPKLQHLIASNAALPG